VSLQPVRPQLCSFIVILTELPAPPEPGEPPPIIVPGTNLYASDVILSTFGNAVLPPGVTFISDGDQIFAPLVDQIFAAGLPFTPVAETGLLQDISADPGAPPAIRIEVQSDVVPEPGTAALFGLGLIALGARRRARS
jgi:hypothetical protein